MNNPENPQPYKLESYNQLHDEVKITEYGTLLIENLKRKPILLSQTIQTVDDIITTGIRLSGLTSEILENDYHDFRIYFVTPHSNEDLCRLVYSSNDNRGLRIEAFSGCSYFGRYYQTQLRDVARARRIPFEMTTVIR